MKAEQEFLRSESKSIEESLQLLERLQEKAAWSPYELIAMGTLLQDIYTGLENILRFRLQQSGETIPRTESWHKDLLLKAEASGLLSTGQTGAFRELLLFRHLHVHGYSHRLDEERLRELATPVPDAVRGFLRSMTE